MAVLAQWIGDLVNPAGVDQDVDRVLQRSRARAEDPSEVAPSASAVGNCGEQTPVQLAVTELSVLLNHDAALAEQARLG